MGEIVYVAKVAHIPRRCMGAAMMSLRGCARVGRRILDAGAETLIALDTHWLSNAGYHVNCASRFDDVHSSIEFPTQLKDLEYHAPGDPELGHAIAAAASAAGDEFNRQCDLRALDLWTQGRWKEFAGMLPTYARAFSGEGWMHDTAMLMGGWDGMPVRVRRGDRALFHCFGHRAGDCAVPDCGVMARSELFIKALNF